MWRTLLRMTLFFLSFTLNVSVKAEVLQEPKGCHNEAVLPCSYFVQGHHEVLQWGGERVRLSKGTSVTRNGPGGYRVVNGEVLVETDNELQLSSVYGALKIKNGRVLVKVNKKKMTFFSLDGVVQYQPRGDWAWTFLPVGFNNFISRVNSKGVAESGYPKPAELDELLPAWASFFNKVEMDELQAQMSDYREPWRLAVDQAGPFYVDTINRQIAALKAERERKRQRRERALREQNYFKEMFRRRNFIE